MRILKTIILSVFLGIGLAAFADPVLRINFITPSIVRVQWSNDGSLQENNTGACVYTNQSVKVEKTENGDEIIFQSSELTIKYSKTNNGIIFEDKDKNIILNQIPNSLKAEPSVQEKIIYDEKSAHVEETANGKVTVKDIIRRDTIGRSTRYYVSFSSQNEKALYGLGSHMEDYLNLVGKTLYLTQHNLKAMLPMLCSTNGYGLLFDAGCAMKFKNDGSITTMQLEGAKTLDYYFIKGARLDDVVAGYRYLTGEVSLMPRYLFGYTQSKERYVSSDDIINTLKEYRRRHVPIDMIVQDWNYWPEGWGYMKMNPKYYPSPKALADSVHSLNAKLMVSIWPNPQWCPEAEDFKKRGMMLEHDVYDVFNPEARKHYWSYAKNEFYSQGFDAWWCDSSEPLDGDWNRIPSHSLKDESKPYSWDDQEYRWQLNKDVLSEALGVERHISHRQLAHGVGVSKIDLSRIKKTRLFYENRPLFMRVLIHEIKRAQNRAKEMNLNFAVRLNCTSDLSPELFKDPETGLNILQLFPDVQFYDYTKVAGRLSILNKYSNYDLTFSYDGYNWDTAQKFLQAGGRVAVVFYKQHVLPLSFAGYNVIDGNKYDMRYIDPAGVIVGLFYHTTGANYKTVDGVRVYEAPKNDFVVFPENKMVKYA